MTATSSATAASSAAPSKNVFRLHGVNVLNRKNIDSVSRLTALEKRRATHILDERQRRDTMNQLLGELANLVRESAAEAQQQYLEQQEQHQQKQLNPDGSEKKPPVKSNSITTLRNAIAEIRRLRSYAGLETATQPCAASLQVASSSPSTPSASRSSSPTAAPQHHSRSSTQQQHLPALAPLASHYAPLSKSYAGQTAYIPAPMAPHHQLQSPPLSPSSPAPQHYASSCSSASSVSPSSMPIHHSSQGPTLPSLFAPDSPVAAAASAYTPSHTPSSQYYQAPPASARYHSSSPYPQHSQYSQYSPRYEPSSSYSSRSLSPSLSSTGSMMLPQPYMQHPSYQSPPSSY
ncbi:hypothetical protein BGZ98_007519 [Dissophora globulifera]|nr:hypothetical protein BGZ98_007519 [Dissophora globulifera]